MKNKNTDAQETNTSKTTKTIVYTAQSKAATQEINLNHIPITLQNEYLEFHRTLSQSSSFEAFKQHVSQKVKTLNLQTWGYTRLDLPNKISASEYISNINEKHLALYFDEKLYLHDLTLQHARLSSAPVFQSQFEEFINQAPYTNEEFEQFEKRVKLNRWLGHNDTYSLSIKSSFANGSVLFTTTSMGMIESEFRHIAIKNTDRLTIISKAIDAVGIAIFPEKFIAAKQQFDELTSSFAFRLLDTIAKRDMTNTEAAEYFGISHMDVHKELANVRQMLGARTNHGAYGKAKEAGYLS